MPALSRPAPDTRSICSDPFAPDLQLGRPRALRRLAERGRALEAPQQRTTQRSGTQLLPPRQILRTPPRAQRSSNPRRASGSSSGQRQCPAAPLSPAASLHPQTSREPLLRERYAPRSSPHEPRMERPISSTVEGA